MEQAEEVRTTKRSEQDDASDGGAVADGAGAADVPHGADGDHGESDQVAAVADGECGREVAEVVHEKSGVERHFKDAAGQGEPSFLKSPEISDAAPDPDVEAALFGNGAGEFADHQGGGQAPEKRSEDEDEECAGVAGHWTISSRPKGPPADHEISGGDQREEGEFAGGL